MDDSKNKEAQHFPVVIANYSPFRLVLRATDKWEPTIREINDNDYDYVKLCRLATFIDIGVFPYSLGICVDGSLVLPATEKFRNREYAVKIFNETLGILLLGGVYCEAVHPSDISYGSLFIKGYLKNYGGGDGRIAKFHRDMRTRSLGLTDSISLLNPISISDEEMIMAYKKGKAFFSKLSSYSPNLLLNGTSNFVKHQWIEGLVFLWTSIEQIVNIIWVDKIMNNDLSQHHTIAGRSSFLKDFRTWTTSTKIEVLFQNRLVSANLYRLLNNARKLRNEFIHAGKSVTENAVKNALEGLFRLLSLVISDFSSDTELISTFEIVLQNQRGELYPKKTVFSVDEVQYYRYLPPLPGDKNWPDSDYEIIDELVLQPIPNK